MLPLFPRHGLQALVTESTKAPCRKGIDSAVDAYNARQPEEKEPEKRIHKSTSNHQTLKETMSQKYSTKGAPSVQMAER